MYVCSSYYLHTRTMWSPPPDANLFVAVTGAFGPPLEEAYHPVTSVVNSLTSTKEPGLTAGAHVTALQPSCLYKDNSDNMSQYTLIRTACALSILEYFQVPSPVWFIDKNIKSVGTCISTI